MAQDTPYEILGTDRTSCPQCGADTVVLCPSRIEDIKTNPAFYICQDCGNIGQVGVGPVPRIQD